MRFTVTKASRHYKFKSGYYCIFRVTKYTFWTGDTIQWYLLIGKNDWPSTVDAFVYRIPDLPHINIMIAERLSPEPAKTTKLLLSALNVFEGPSEARERMFEVVGSF